MARGVANGWKDFVLSGAQKATACTSLSNSVLLPPFHLFQILPGEENVQLLALKKMKKM